jgi:hypothetical protein
MIHDGTIVDEGRKDRKKHGNKWDLCCFPVK